MTYLLYHDNFSILTQTAPHIVHPDSFIVLKIEKIPYQITSLLKLHKLHFSLFLNQSHNGIPYEVSQTSMSAYNKNIIIIGLHFTLCL